MTSPIRLALINDGGTWVKTSYNTSKNKHAKGGQPLRKNFAGRGYKYDLVRDAFIPPKANCHAEETLDNETCVWVCNNPEHDVIV